MRRGRDERHQIGMGVGGGFGEDHAQQRPARELLPDRRVARKRAGTPGRNCARKRGRTRPVRAPHTAARSPQYGVHCVQCHERTQSGNEGAAIDESTDRPPRCVPRIGQLRANQRSTIAPQHAPRTAKACAGRAARPSERIPRSRTRREHQIGLEMRPDHRTRRAADCAAIRQRGAQQRGRRAEKKRYDDEDECEHAKRIARQIVQKDEGHDEMGRRHRQRPERR